jgi:tetrahydromethanopterin S-methyltransferase subunit G
METLKMERQMDSWNDGRLDELSGRMDEGFANVDKRFGDIDKRFERVEAEMRQGFENVATKEELTEVKGEFRYLNERLDRLLHALAVVSVGFGATLFAALAGFIATQV